MTQLIVACVAQAAREVDGGWNEEVPARLIEENMWRAIRHGLDGRLLDLEAERVEEYEASEAIERLCAWAGIDRVALPDLNGAQRQRRMLDAGATPAEVYAECVRETQATYREVMR